MTTTSIIALVIILLVIGIAMSAVVQHREQVKREKRQQLAKFRYRAREGQELYDRFFDQPITAQTRLVILQYIALNLTKALQVDPTQSDLKKSLQMINEKIANPEAPADSDRLTIPSDTQECMVLMGRFKNLMRYVHKIAKVPGVDIAAANKGIGAIKKLYFKIQIHTYLLTARKKIEEKNLILARQFTEGAQKQLIRFNISDPNIQSLLQEVESLQTQITQLHNAEDQIPTVLEEESAAEKDFGDSDDLFQPKKKW